MHAPQRRQWCTLRAVSRSGGQAMGATLGKRSGWPMRDGRLPPTHTAFLEFTPFGQETKGGSFCQTRVLILRGGDLDTGHLCLSQLSSVHHAPAPPVSDKAGTETQSLRSSKEPLSSPSHEISRGDIRATDERARLPNTLARRRGACESHLPRRLETLASVAPPSGFPSVI